MDAAQAQQGIRRPTDAPALTFRGLLGPEADLAVLVVQAAQQRSSPRSMSLKIHSRIPPPVLHGTRGDPATSAKRSKSPKAGMRSHLTD